VQVGRGATVAGRGRDRLGLGVGGQDALDGPVRRVVDLKRLGAGRLQPPRADPVPVGKAEHALGGTQTEQRVDSSRAATSREQAGPIPAARSRHHVGVRIRKAIFSGG
jgi:hypothetical protein